MTGQINGVILTINLDRLMYLRYYLVKCVEEKLVGDKHYRKTAFDESSHKSAEFIF